MEEKNNKKMILAIIGVIVLIAGVVGLTIAYFKAKAESENITVSSKRLSIVFSEGEDSLIRATDIEPIADSDIDTLATKKTFTVAKANDTDKDVCLKFELIDLEVSDNFKDSDLRWALYKEGELVTEGSFVNVKDSDTLPLANNIYLDTTTPAEYNLYIWIRENEAEQERLMGGSLSGKIQVTGTEKSTEGIVNEGVLASGMIPVVYDEENDVWVKAGGDTGWYDYDNQMWANVVTVRETVPEWDGITGDVNIDGKVDEEDVDYITGSLSSTITLTDEQLKRAEVDGITGDVNINDSVALHAIINNGANASLTSKSLEEYLAAEPGTTIEMVDIENFYTWIPRYKYKINNTGTIALPSAIDVVFENGVTSTGVDINTDGVAVTEYYTHPSFRDGSSVYKTTAYDQSGWDSELFGYWVSKFEVDSYQLDSYFKVYTKPDHDIDGSMCIGEYHQDYISDNKPYQDYTHIMKNTEWGAIAYLSQSKYGKMGNSNFTGANKEIFINNSSNYYTGRSSGGPAGVVKYKDVYPDWTNSRTENNLTLNPGFYTYDNYLFSYSSLSIRGEKTTLVGEGASTTGNITGVYDMVGGRTEYVMSNYNNSIGSSEFSSDFFTTESNKKYYDNYDSTKTYILGDATYETSGWYSDDETNMDDDNPFLIRGGSYNSSTEGGIFNYSNFTGSCDTYNSFRYIIIP